MAAVFFVAGTLQLRRSWPAVGDFAVAELVVRHLSRHLPLSGPYSAERGYNHPLPWVYAILWVPYRLFGRRSAAAPAMALWWNGAWAAFVVWLLARRNAIGLGLSALATILVLAVSIEGVVLLLPWNPDLAVMPAFVLLFVSWRVAAGDASLLPLAVGLAVWCVGAHLGFLPFAAALIVTASASLIVVTAARTGARSLKSLGVPALFASGTAAVLALPMEIDLAVNGSHSNPARIVKWLTTSSSRSIVPASQAMKVLRAELAIPPTWTRTAPPYDIFLYHPPVHAPWILVIAAATAAAAWRRRAFEEIAGIGVCLIALGAATLGLLRVDGSMLAPWYILPAHIAGAGLVAFVVWSGEQSIAALAARTRRPTVPRLPGRRATWEVALVVVCALATAAAVADMHTPPFQQTIASTTAQLVTAVEQQVPRGTRVVVEAPVDVDGYYSESFTLQLDRAGYSVRVPNADVYIYTSALAIPKGWKGTRLVLTIAGPALTPPRAGASLVASVVVPQNVEFAGRTLAIWKTARTAP